MAFGVKDNGFAYFLLIYYNQVLGLPATAVGAALTVTDWLVLWVAPSLSVTVRLTV